MLLEVKMRCGDCKFYVGITDDLHEREQCRRHPPSRANAIDEWKADLLRDIACSLSKMAKIEYEETYPLHEVASEVREARWPYADEDDWCGEFQPK